MADNTYRPSVADVRAIRAFAMSDADLEGYIDLADGVATNTAIPDSARKQMWALFAAHLATVMREPEPTGIRVGPLQTSFAAATSPDGLLNSAPGREYQRRLKKYNRGWVLR